MVDSSFLKMMVPYLFSLAMEEVEETDMEQLAMALIGEIQQCNLAEKVVAKS